MLQITLSSRAAIKMTTPAKIGCIITSQCFIIIIIIIVIGSGPLCTRGKL
jgi:hypothetical protein